jgi:hypothetical protein
MALSRKCCSAEASDKTAYKHIWRLWGKFYSIGKLHGLMRKNHLFPAVLLPQRLIFAVSGWLSTPPSGVFADPLRAVGVFGVILLSPSFYSAKVVAVTPELWHVSAIRKVIWPNEPALLP